MLAPSHDLLFIPALRVLSSKGEEEPCSIWNLETAEDHHPFSSTDSSPCREPPIPECECDLYIWITQSSTNLETGSDCVLTVSQVHLSLIWTPREHEAGTGHVF